MLYFYTVQSLRDRWDPNSRWFAVLFRDVNCVLLCIKGIKVQKIKSVHVDVQTVDMCCILVCVFWIKLHTFMLCLMNCSSQSFCVESMTQLLSMESMVYHMSVVMTTSSSIYLVEPVYMNGTMFERHWYTNIYFIYNTEQCICSCSAWESEIRDLKKHDQAKYNL